VESDNDPSQSGSLALCPAPVDSVENCRDELLAVDILGIVGSTSDGRVEAW
jgi:hypothetical protein